jgi:hypothetical protein
LPWAPWQKQLLALWQAQMQLCQPQMQLCQWQTQMQFCQPQMQLCQWQTQMQLNAMADSQTQLWLVWAQTRPWQVQTQLQLWIWLWPHAETTHRY